MMTRSLVVRSAWALSVLGLALACGSDPASPTQPGPTRTISSVTIDGPSTLAPGQAARYSAVAAYPDGSREDVTATAFWTSETTWVMSVDRTGLATAREGGTARIKAAVGPRSATRSIIVVPAGTYRVTGRVMEADIIAPVRDARVEVTAGTGAGLASTTDDDGRYALHGVGDDSEVTVSKFGYRSQVLRPAPVDHLTQDVQLVLAAPRPSVAGTYQLRITVDPMCPDPPPESLRTRTYVATLKQFGTHISVELSGARFARDFTGQVGVFEGRLEPRGLIFNLISEGWRYYSLYEYPDITEILDGDAGWLVVGGAVVAAPAANGFAGSVEGPFVLFARDPALNPPVLASCRGSHSFVLTPSAP
jgi:hypothetical protein